VQLGAHLDGVHALASGVLLFVQLGAPLDGEYALSSGVLFIVPLLGVHTLASSVLLIMQLLGALGAVSKVSGSCLVQDLLLGARLDHAPTKGAACIQYVDKQRILTLCERVLVHELARNVDALVGRGDLSALRVPVV
jgi:hypothetical protein